MADFEINIPASAVKELKKAMDMGFGVDISLSIGGNVTVSGGGGVPATQEDLTLLDWFLTGDTSGTPSKTFDTFHGTTTASLAFNVTAPAAGKLVMLTYGKNGEGLIVRVDDNDATEIETTQLDGSLEVWEYEISAAGTYSCSLDHIEDGNSSFDKIMAVYFVASGRTVTSFVGLPASTIEASAAAVMHVTSDNATGYVIDGETATNTDFNGDIRTDDFVTGRRYFGESGLSLGADASFVGLNATVGFFVT